MTPSSVDRTMPKMVVFLTHRAAEREMAAAIKRAIEAAFPGVDVFLSSDPENIGAGDPWVESISNTLSSCEVQIILASPASLARPWVHFEAGSGWRRVVQIPMCHSGQEPGGLPIPLSLLQAGRVTDPEFLQAVFEKIAKVAENRMPSVNFTELASELKAIEDDYQSSGIAAIPAAPASVVSRATGPEMRALSDERQRLESRLYAAILKWNTLRSKGAVGDTGLTLRAIEVADAFWADPKSFVLDHEVAAALATIEASIDDLEKGTAPAKPIRTQLLRALREMSYRQDETSEILRFDLNAFAAQAATSRDRVARTLRDLLTEGLVEPNYATMGEGEMQGAVKISAAGLREIRQLDEDG